MTREFRRQFGRSIPEMEAFGVKLNKLYEALRDSFCQKRSVLLIANLLKWKNMITKYGSPLLDESAAAPSQEWVALMDYFLELRVAVQKCLNIDTVFKIISSAIVSATPTVPFVRLQFGVRIANIDRSCHLLAVVHCVQEELFQCLLEPNLWNADVTLGHGGVQQFALDIK